MKKGLTFFLVAAIIITLFLTQAQNVWGDIRGNSQSEKVSLNEFISLYQENTFDTVKVIDATKLEWHQVLTLTGNDNPSTFMSLKTKEENTKTTIYKTNKPLDTPLSDLGILLTGNANGTTIEVVYNEASFWSKVLVELIPLVLLIAGFFFLMRLLAPKGWAGMPFISSAGKLTNKKEITTRFNDVIGMEEVKQELTEIVDYLKNPQKYHKVGARVPKWVLLHGAPGSGKTLLARAVAWEAHVPFFSASGPEFIEMFVGAGTLKVRDLFKRAKQAGKAIIFIDEIDSIGAKRGRWPSGAHKEQENMLNQILTEMDGFEKDTSIIVIAATNRPDILDPALLRSGRFDRKVRVGRPTTDERQLIFDYYLKEKSVDKNIDMHSLALRTSWLVGADIENIVNEATLKIAKESRTILTKKDFEYALEKVIMGPEKKIKTMKAKEREIITYHELGHAITAHVLPDGDPVEKISIVSRGMALWVTWKIPEEEKHLYSKAKLQSEMVTLLGWRAAEELFFGKEEITTGASNDFMRATAIASDMVLKYGMDEELWPVMYHNEDSPDVYYGQVRRYSDKTAELADQRIKGLLGDAYKEAIKIIKQHKKTVSKMAEVLLEKEYLSKQEFIDIFNDITAAETILAQYKIESEQEEKALALAKEKEKKEAAQKKTTTKKKPTKRTSKKVTKKNTENE